MIAVKKLNDHFPISKLQHLKRAKSSNIRGRHVISVILWECEEPQPSSSPVSRHEEHIAARLAQIQDLDLTEAIEAALPVARVAAVQPQTTEQFQQLRREEDYW